MPQEHCFVCASNEGIFIDIFTDGKNYRDIIESCLSLKIQKKKILSSKICHKCVYELDQCSKFVQRYKKTHRIEKGKLYRKRGCCCLCMEPGKKGYIFNLWDENRLDNSVEKLHALFEIDFVTDNLCSLSICLDCRYNLDVLFDLKNLFRDTSRCLEDIMNGDMALSELPKINTNVVKRKTTLARMSKLSQSKSSLAESDTSTIVIESPKRRRAVSSRKSSPHERRCDECNIKIDNGMDMYRYHHTGNTVCKECWLTMDPCEKTKNKARKVNNKTMKTKLCSVFLKDILTETLETEKPISNCKVEKGIDGEIIYVISSDETDNENEKKMLSTRLEKTKRKKHGVETKPTKKLKTQHTKRTKLTRSNSAQSINVINKKNTRQTRSESAETSDSEGKNLRKRSETIGKSVASTSKSMEEKKLKQSLPRAVKSKKRRTDQLESSSSSHETIMPSKVRRFSSPSYKFDSTDSKNESDSDNRPYICKICSNDFENKVVGMTHELTHSKKLEVMLEKVEMPGVTEEDETIEREPSIEFASPAPSNEGPTDTASDFHLAITDDSTLRELSDIPEDPSDDDVHSQNPEESTTSKCEEDNSGEDGEKKKKETGKAKNKRKETVKNKKKELVKDKKKETAKDKKKETVKDKKKETAKDKKKDTRKEKKETVEDEEEITEKEKGKEKETVEEKDKENEIQEAEEKEKDTVEEKSASESIKDLTSVHKDLPDDEVDDIHEKLTDTPKPSIDDELPELNDKDSSKKILIEEDDILADDKSDKENENKIENVDKNSLNKSGGNKDVEDLLENSEKVDVDEKDSALPIAFIEGDTEKLSDENNQEKNENKTVENENFTSDNKEPDESKGVDEEQKDEEKIENKISEDKNEKSSDEVISNGNVLRKLSGDKPAEINDDEDGIDKSKGTECTIVSSKSEENSDPDSKVVEEKNDDVVTDEVDDVLHAGEIESSVKDTEIDMHYNKDTKNESSEIENRLAEMMGESEVKEPEVTEEKMSDEHKNTEQMPSSESITIENVECES